jgi:hypothetical protein
MFGFHSSEDLRAEMTSTGAIISGSAALSLIHPRCFCPNDLDFYVLPRGYASLLAFVQLSGYAVNAKRDLCRERDTAVAINLVHPDSEQEINIVAVLEEHVVHAVAKFHSTLVMNYVAWYGLVSLYPDWTFAKRGLIVKETPETIPALEKYRGRGFVMAASNTSLINDDLDHWCEMGPECPKTKRDLLDKHCLFAPFRGMAGELGQFEQDPTWALTVRCGYAA